GPKGRRVKIAYHYGRPPPPPPGQYSARVYALQADYKNQGLNVSLDDVKKVADAADAVAGASWDIGGDGIQLTLSAEQCKSVAIAAGVVASLGAEQTVKALTSGPWYAVLIWAAVAADFGIVASTLSQCASNGKRGKLIWVGLLGVLWA